MGLVGLEYARILLYAGRWGPGANPLQIPRDNCIQFRLDRKA